MKNGKCVMCINMRFVDTTNRIWYCSKKKLLYYGNPFELTCSEFEPCKIYEIVYRDENP